MRIYKTLTKKKIAVLWTITGLILSCLLIFPVQCRAGAANGVFLCIQVLIPSLFPFMVLSSFVVCSGLSSKTPKFLGRITETLFRLPKDTFVVVLLSLIGGYPVGAKGINSLCKENKISKRQAEQMALFCVSAGPGFMVTYLGCSMLGNKQAGYILLSSQIVSFLLLGIISKFSINSKSDNKEQKQYIYITSAENPLVYSVSEAIKSCGFMCALVVLFGSFCEIFLYITKNIPYISWVTALIEITNGTKILAQRYPIVLMSAMCGFGGLCVHFQVFTLLGEIKISKFKFFIFRGISAILNAIVTYILLRIFPLTESVFSTVEKSTPALNKGISGCILLIICCVVFLASLKTSKIHSYKSR